jgi:Do/DeqQ family serine protease
MGVCVLFVCAGTGSAQNSANPSASGGGKDLVHALNQAYEDVFAHVAPAVVVIDVAKSGSRSSDNNPFEGFDFFFKSPRGEDGADQSEQSEGSGFFVRSDGYIVTNFHVIEGADKIRVKTQDGRTFIGKITGTDERTDIAVLKVDGIGFTAAEFANSDDVKVGQIVCAIGAPYKFDYSFTTGVVSAKGRNELLSDKYEDYIQTDAAINPGNSGGPLCDLDGRVIGVNTLIHGLNKGLGFAISSNLTKQVSDQLIETGKIVRPWLGVIIESLTDQNRTAAFKGVDRGVLVRTIQADTPAAKSDLRPADIITDVDGVSVASARDLQREILKKKVGASVALGVWRNGKRVVIPVKTEQLPSETSQVVTQPTVAPTPSPTDASSDFGAQIEEITPALKQQLGLDIDRGVVVTGVEPESPAAVADIQVGDVITEVGRMPVTDSASFIAAVTAQKSKNNLLLLLDRKGVKTYSIVRVGK